MDLKHEVHILVTIAKVDAELNRHRIELEGIPAHIARIQREIGELERSHRQATEHFEAMKKERRQLEVNLQDNGELLKKYKTQLMGVKSNKEYTALLKEIEKVERDTDEKEERLLILMDEIESQSKENERFLSKVEEEIRVREEEKRQLEAKEKSLRNRMSELEGKKPALLCELNASLRKRYERILAKLGDFAVANIDGEICQGCFSKIPAQTANEVKLNDRIITCEACGRILVHY